MRLIVVNGFLGSGKTTFIKAFLTDHPSVFPIIVNEFGKSAYDQKQLEDKGYPITLINRGSIFCTCKADEFIKVLSSLMSDDPAMIMIESSGFADPSGMDTLIALALRKAGLNETEVCALSIADPLTFMKLIGSMAMLRRQIEVADTILINKTDLSDQETLGKLSKTMRLMNPQALITQGTYGKIDKDLLKTHRVTSDHLKDKVAKKDLFNTAISVSVKPWKDEQSVLDFLSEIQPTLFRLKGRVQVNDRHYQIEIATERFTMIPCDDSDGQLALMYSERLNDFDKLNEILRKVTIDDQGRSL